MSTVTSPNAQPTPALFFETVNAYHKTEALKAAIELDIFTAIAEGALTPAAIGARCGASERGARILCDYLAISGFLTKDGGRYALTPESAAFLSRRSPAYLGRALEFLNSRMLMDEFKGLSAAVRKGGTVSSELGNLSPEHPIWVEFAHAMAPVMSLPAREIARLLHAAEAGAWQVLDIAAGHGLFGIALAQANPRAGITAVDWPAVLGIARDNAARAGVAERYRTVPGSAFEAQFGGPYDVVLLTNFLHHFDPAQCEILLRKVHAALKPGGRAVTLEFVPNDDRVTPHAAAQFALTMLATTPAGDAYTFSEYEAMFRRAGFHESAIYDIAGTVERVIVSVA